MDNNTDILIDRGTTHHWNNLYPRWAKEVCPHSGMEKADLRESDLSWADLSIADLSGADLSEADLSWADLTEAWLQHANLNGADLSGANLKRADLSGATVTDEHLPRARPWRAPPCPVGHGTSERVKGTASICRGG